MPRYFFNIEHDPSGVDDEGHVLPGICAARRAATKLAAAVLADQVDCADGAKDLLLEVSEDGGLVVFSLQITAYDSQHISANDSADARRSHRDRRAGTRANLSRSDSYGWSDQIDDPLA
jgi:hypothetical protein